MGRKRLEKVWGDTPRVVEMQSEAGAIATCMVLCKLVPSQHRLRHRRVSADDPNAVQTGRRTDAVCPAVAARTVATHALSIFGDHSDVWRCARRVARCCVQQASRKRRLCSHFAHRDAEKPRAIYSFFDGFRTSHEINKIVPLADDTFLN